MEEISLVGAKEIHFGVGWETQEQNLDLDSIVAVFDKWGNHVETIDGLSRTTSRCGSILHHGDDVTGGKDGDAETIGVNLTTLEKRTEVLVLIVTIMRGDFVKVDSIHARVICDIPDPEASFGTGIQFQPDDELMKYERSCKLPEENTQNIAMMIRLKRVKGGLNRWVAQTMGVLGRTQDVVTAVQENLLDIFPKLKIAGKDMGLRAVTDVMNRLDVRTIHKLENDFVKSGDEGDGLNVYEFCECMIKHLDLLSGKEDKLHIVSLLTEMFNQIDVDGDGSMEWEEFTAFVIQSGLMATQGGAGGQANEASDLQFVRDKYEDKVVHGKEIRIIEFFPGLNHFLVASEKADHVKMFDHNSTYVRTLQIPEDPQRLAKIVVLDTEYCHEENVLAVAASDFSITLWDMRKGRLGKNEPKILRTLKAPTSQVSMVWCHNHRTLFTAGVNLEIIAWNVKTQSVLGKLVAHKDMIMHVICIEELDMIVSAGLDKMIHLYGIPEMAHFGSCKGHRKGVRRICYGHNMLFSCGFEYTVRAWEIDLNEAGKRFAEGKQVMTLKGHTVMLLDVQCVPSEQPMVVSCDVNGNFKVWDVGTFATFSGEGIELQEFTPGNSLTCPIRCFFLSSKCTSGPIPGSESNPEPMKAICTLVAAANEIVRFSMVSIQSKSVLTPKLVLYNHSTLQFFSVSGPDVHMWDASHGGKVHSFWDIFGNSKYITSMTFDNRKRKFIAGSEDGRVVVFNSVSGEKMKYGHPHKAEVTGVTYCGQCRCIISSSSDGRLVVLDENVDEELQSLRVVKKAHLRGIYCSEYCEQYGLIATGSSDGTLRVWNFVDLKLQVECVGHMAQICAATFVVPYNVLISVDCAGNILGWHLPFDRRIPGDRGIIYPTTSFSLTGVPKTSVFTCFQWHDFSDPKTSDNQTDFRRVAAVSDDRGMVTEFDLTAALTKMKAVAVENIPIDDPQYNPYLKFSAYKFLSPKIPKEQIEQALTGGSVNHIDLEPLRRFKANSDAIQYLTFVDKPPMLATASFDDKIKLFSEAIGDDDDPLGEMCLKPLEKGDIEPEWLVPLEGNNLGERQRKDAQTLLNAAEQEEYKSLMIEKRNAKQRIEMLDALQKFKALGLIKDRAYSDNDVMDSVRKLKSQLAAFENFDDISDEKVARLRAMLEQVHEGEETDGNITWGEFFDTMGNVDSAGKAFSKASVFSGSLRGLFGGEEISRLETIRKRGMHKIYEYMPPGEADAKSKTMMPQIQDMQANTSPLLGYLNLRKELHKRGDINPKGKSSDKQLARALKFARPSKFLLEHLGPKKKRRKSKPFLGKNLSTTSLSKSSSFFSKSMQSVAEESSMGNSFFLTGGNIGSIDMDDDSPYNGFSLPTIPDQPFGTQQKPTKERKKKSNRYGSTINEIMARANEILKESDDIEPKVKKERRKRASILAGKKKDLSNKEEVDRVRKSSIKSTRRLSSSFHGSKKKGQWRIRHYQKQEVMEVIHSFQKLDEDVTGTIDVNEFLRLPQFEGMDKGSIDHLFRTIDKDGGGSVNMEELLGVMFPKATESDLQLMLEMAHAEQYTRKKEQKASVLTSTQRIEIETIFDMYDTDNSNSVSLVELLEALGRKLQGILSAQEISDIFATADKDGNEDLDRDEFVKLYEEYFLVPVQDHEDTPGPGSAASWS
jgi:WD40 repeat protein